MPYYCYSFMMEWGGCICGVVMILFTVVCIVAVFTFFKKLYRHISGKLDSEDNINIQKDQLDSHCWRQSLN